MSLKQWFFCLFFAAAITVPAWASYNEDGDDVPSVSIPVEVAMTYLKKTKTQPNFDELAKLGNGYLEAPDFAKNVMLYQEKQILQDIYNKADKKPIIVFDDFKVEVFSRDEGVFSFNDFNFDKYYRYNYDGETYVVFIRNINDYEKLAIQEGTSAHISRAFINKSTVAAELTLKPVTADKKLFPLDDGKQAHLILADLVDLKLIVYNSGKIFYHDIASEWKPKSRLDRVVKETALDQNGF